MQILSAEEIRAWDEYTIMHEPITSIALMERAVSICFEWLRNGSYLGKSFSVFCGKGNNGGDGLALARMLLENDSPVVIYILEFGHKGTDDFQANLARLHERKADIRFIQTEENIHPIPADDIIIDALFGSGLNRPLEGLTAKLVRHINDSGNEIISIDIPSGLFVSKSSKGNPVIKASNTLSFQCYKLAFLVAENSLLCGKVHVLDIGLHQDYLKTIPQKLSLVDKSFIRSIFKRRNEFAHKGNFGHALLLAGSYGKMGAAALAAKACLRSGVGLLTVHIPKCGYEVMQTSIPEAMVLVDEDEKVNTTINEDLSKYNVIGIGPGIGTDEKTKKLLGSVLSAYKKPVIADADALNIISVNKELFQKLSPYSVLTPHPKEFERLFGEEENDFARIESAQRNAAALQCVIVLKGHYTFIALPDGTGYFNSTGNAGMAKGGSGDVLTGMVTAFSAQGYSSAHAAVLAVYLHGLAGDFAANYLSQQSMLASDINDCIGQAISSLS
ncbi:MAG: NAD(P)H-hydrate dehydratase [Bacteroidetes bacterium]|nr:NAD(P)H-hydrate dehydratase [Bacteroidota bacterium]